LLNKLNRKEHPVETSTQSAREAIVDNVRRIRKQLAKASERYDAPPLLLVVTKQQPAERINLLRAADIDQIGESRVQEWRQKTSALDPAFSLHWIGRLQTNKIRYIIEQVCLVHSFDRPALAEELGKQARQVGRRVPALAQVNIAGEAQKAGLAPGEVLPFLRQYGGHPGLEIQGLMTIMPLVADPEILRPYFREMRSRFEEIQKMHIPGVEMRHLSMGMSADYVVAVQEGATIVRIGSAVFG
jgi:pyridoxal phosphate enzyme (YggS family)